MLCIQYAEPLVPKESVGTHVTPFGLAASFRALASAHLESRSLACQNMDDVAAMDRAANATFRKTDASELVQRRQIPSVRCRLVHVADMERGSRA
jgi:hypothetical protein